ncbi:MAG TPA: SAF domain-containing protein [Mycobacteriales bacterium]|nr:SAF domain-containing protein [Mycobacteriales bacterium]
MNTHRVRAGAALHPILTRFGRWPRRLLAAVLLLAALAVELSGWSTTPGPEPPADHSVTVLAAARDLTAGSVLRAADVRPLRLPPAAVPAHALTDGRAVLGRRVAGPLRRGEALTDVRLVDPGLTAGLSGSGLVAVPVRLADPATAVLLRPGSRVDLLARSGADDTGPGDAGPESPQPAVVLAADVTVLAVVPVGSDRSGGPLLVVAAAPDTARRLAGAGGDAGLTVTLRPP